MISVIPAMISRRAENTDAGISHLGIEGTCRREGREPQPSTLNPQSSTRHPQLDTLNPKPWTQTPKPMRGGKETRSHTSGSSTLRFQSRETRLQRRREAGGSSERIWKTRQSEFIQPPRCRGVPPGWRRCVDQSRVVTLLVHPGQQSSQGPPRADNFAEPLMAQGPCLGRRRRKRDGSAAPWQRGSAQPLLLIAASTRSPPKAANQSWLPPPPSRPPGTER